MEIIGNVAQNVWISYVVDKKHPELKKHNKESLPAAEKKKLLWDIKSLAMYKAGFALGNGVDNIIISACVNTSAVGLVSNYTMIRKELEQLLKQFYNAMIPSVGNLSVTAPRDKQHEVFSNLMFLNFWISCFCSVSYFALIQPFISFWLGTKYVLPVTVAITLALDFYLACMMETIASFRTANGIFVKGQYRPLIMLIINLFLSVILGIRWGIAGVFAATVASRLLTQWYDPYLLYKLVFKRSPKQFYFRYYTYLIFTVSCAALVYLAAESISVNNLFLTLILRAILCVLVPNGLIVLVYNRTAEFRYCIAQAGKFVQKVRKKGKRDRV
jgi:O-antigen/teichoic acid export membrane protein